MDDIVTLSDSELRKELLAHGVNVGPVTPTTRGVYQKKLMQVLSGETSQESIEHEDGDDDEDIVQGSTKYTSIQQSTPDKDYEIKSSFEEPFQHISTPKPDLHHKCPPDLYIQESPYSRHYEPVDDVLRRRPFYTPSGGSVKRSAFTTQSTPVATKAQCSAQIPSPPVKSSKPWCRVVLIILALFLILVALVYYHMEPNIWRGQLSGKNK